MKLFFFFSSYALAYADMSNEHHLTSSNITPPLDSTWQIRQFSKPHRTPHHHHPPQNPLRCATKTSSKSSSSLPSSKLFPFTLKFSLKASFYSNKHHNLRKTQIKLPEIHLKMLLPWRSRQNSITLNVFRRRLSKAAKWLSVRRG